MVDRKKFIKALQSFQNVNTLASVYEKARERAGGSLFFAIVAICALIIILPWLHAFALFISGVITWGFELLQVAPFNEGTTISIAFVLVALGLFVADRHRRQSKKPGKGRGMKRVRKA